MGFFLKLIPFPPQTEIRIKNISINSFKFRVLKNFDRLITFVWKIVLFSSLCQHSIEPNFKVYSKIPYIWRFYLCFSIAMVVFNPNFSTLLAKLFFVLIYFVNNNIYIMKRNISWLHANEIFHHFLPTKCLRLLLL